VASKEIRLSVAMVLLLGGVLFSMRAVPAHTELAAEPAVAHALADLEDEFAQHPNDVVLGRELAREYLRLDRPALVIAAVLSVDPGRRADPLLTHWLARAYERSGRMHDAVATAHLAVMRCAEAAGSSRVFSVGESSDATCNQGTLVRLEMHANALAMMSRWGVQDARTDQRAKLAYQLAERTVSIASLASPSRAAEPKAY
jgi:hypothetical protein